MHDLHSIDLARRLPTLERAFDFAAGQVKATVARHPDFFPIYTEGGRWRHQGELWTDWCGGFHAGMMWLIARRSGSAFWLDTAQHYSRLLEPRQFDRDVHDLGFIFLNTYLPWYALTGDRAVHQVLITAGRTLALRYREAGRYLRSFIGPESLFIDIMMNVPLIFYAARETGDQALFSVAAAHCETTRRFLIRPDGSTAHEGLFDLETGVFLGQSTQQGLRADSTWARGLAWSLHGFALVYPYTNDPADLETAWRNADCWLARCGDRPIPPWDFDAPAGAGRIDDSSAAAIAASGLWKLAKLTDALDRARSHAYRQAALGILLALCTDYYLAWSTPGWEGVLKHGVYHIHKGLGVDESVMWGDFFFLEAVDQILTDAGALTHPDPTGAQD